MKTNLFDIMSAEDQLMMAGDVNRYGCATMQVTVYKDGRPVSAKRVPPEEMVADAPKEATKGRLAKVLSIFGKKEGGEA